MSVKEYDIAIVGGSLTARIAAALLAKAGRKVLFLRQQEQSAPTWFHSSLFLEHLLGILGGRSCFVTPKPFQVLSAYARITLHNDTPLEKELNRELGEGASKAIALFQELSRIGEDLEQLFWENLGLPWPGVKNSARFRMHCLRFKLRPQELTQPLQQKFQDQSEAAQKLLTDLFQGLSLRSISTLSLAEGALLCYHVSRAEDLAEPDFSQLLRKRFEQFHGAVIDLETLSKIDFDGTRFIGGTLKEGGRFQAKTFVIGDSRWSKLFEQGFSSDITSQETIASLQTTDLRDQLSPLLEHRVIPGGDHPLRISIETTDEEYQSAHISTCSHLSETDLRQQLEVALPFARFELSTQNALNETPRTSPAKTVVTPLLSLPFKLANNLYMGDDKSLLPSLGAAGAALLGWTLAHHLSEGQAMRRE
jgi:hypothetical protein